MYELFLEVNKECIKQPVDDSFIERYKGVLPGDMFIFWREIGITTFRNGLFRLINPIEYQNFVDEYIESGKEQFEFLTPFMTTAFGDIFAWVKDIKQETEYVIYINIRKGFWDIITSEMKLLFNNYTSLESYLAHYFDLKLSDYTKLTEKLGIPQANQCYAYVPALVLGGKEKLSNVQLVETKPYLDLVCQATGNFDLK